MQFVMTRLVVLAMTVTLTSVPVIPPKFRPFSITGDTFLPGDSNEVYRDLLEYRRLYADTEKVLGKEGASDAYMDLYRATKAAYGYDPRTGKELWRVDHPAYSGAARPVCCRSGTRRRRCSTPRSAHAFVNCFLRAGSPSEVAQTTCQGSLFLFFCRSPPKKIVSSSG
jgi:hypothetical protein